MDDKKLIADGVRSLTDAEICTLFRLMNIMGLTFGRVPLVDRERILKELLDSGELKKEDMLTAKEIEWLSEIYGIEL